jgi:hypothetical protein
MSRPLDRLYRFCEHDNGNEDCVWTVSGGSLEKNKRYYRIMYDESEKKEWELIIDVNESQKKWLHEIDTFKNQIIDWMKTYPVSAFYARALFELFSMDPWLSHSVKTINLLENN